MMNEREKENEWKCDRTAGCSYVYGIQRIESSGRFTTEMLFSLKSTIMSNRSEESQQKFTEKLQYETVPSAGLFSHPELCRLFFLMPLVYF